MNCKEYSFDICIKVIPLEKYPKIIRYINDVCTAINNKPQNAFQN